MKSILILVLSLFVFTSCLKENHSIRLKNNMSIGVSSLIAGSTRIDGAPAGGQSAYVPIKTGNFTISGTDANGQPITGKGYVKGKGTHKWTIYISVAGTLSVAED